MLFKAVLKSQVAKFAIVGASCAAVEFIVFSLLINIYKIEYLISNILSVIVAVGLNYLLSRKFVFQPSKYARYLEVTSFVLFSLMAIFLNQSILWFFVEKGVISNVQIGKAITIVIVAAFNFVTKKYIVFKQ